MQRLGLLFIAFLASSIVLVSTAGLGTVYASTPVNHIINSDTTWTKANSPYSFEGPVSVNTGVTLTIEAGVTVNINDYYLQVNGTLRAIGTENEEIVFNSSPQEIQYQPKARLYFTPASDGYNEQTGAGSILENVFLPDFSKVGSSVKITKCTITQLTVDGGSSIISENTIAKLTISGGSPTVTNNEITGAALHTGDSFGFDISGGAPKITSNRIHIRPWFKAGAPTFTDNKLMSGIHADANSGQIIIYNNEISGSGDFTLIHIAGRIQAYVTKNIINGLDRNPTGISVGSHLTYASITNNQISNCKNGIAIRQDDVHVSKNKISNNEIGINIDLISEWPGKTIKPPTVKDNTISENSIGIQYSPAMFEAVITNNNIQDNTQYNFKLQHSDSVTIADNWWGTTDSEAIGQKIFDNKNDFNIGYVTFTPFLTARNPQAMPDENAPIPTSTTSAPSATTTPSMEPTQTLQPTDTANGVSSNFNWEQAFIVALVVVVAILLVIVSVLLRKRRTY
jgi:hypothetical protein